MTAIYTTSFESMMLFRKKLMLFFEYNSFAGNYVYITNPSLLTGIIDSKPMQELPFRITDITPSGKNSFTALNVFYKGEEAIPYTGFPEKTAAIICSLKKWSI